MSSPRPWKYNPEWSGPGHGVDSSPIIDSNGDPIIEISEWFQFEDKTLFIENMKLIIDAVNAYDK
jgi:hypothetical protein